MESWARKKQWNLFKKQKQNPIIINTIIYYNVNKLFEQDFIYHVNLIWVCFVRVKSKLYPT